MSSRTRNLLLAAAVPVVMVVVAWSLLPDGSQDADHRTGKAAAPSPTSSPHAAQGVAENFGDLVVQPGRRGYAVAVPELKGLPVEAAPGTRLELWVAWDPPVTKEPRVQRLIADVVLDEIIPPLVPEAPASAILSVPTNRVPDLLYGDRYGALSATILPGD